MFLWTAFVFGLLGSFHCIGMCGPIALALPIHNYKGWQKAIGSLSYNAGRILTYAVLGAALGLIGQIFRIAKIQQVLSIVMGVVILLAVIIPLVFRSKPSFYNPFYGLVAKLKGRFSKQLKKRSFSSLFGVGLLNGLLPCGMVYLAMAGALATTTSSGGAIYMAAFGLGTLPVMFSVPLLGNFMPLSWRNTIRKAVPAIVVIFGLLFILRGMNLGIPYLSPHISEGNQSVEACH